MHFLMIKQQHVPLLFNTGVNTGACAGQHAAGVTFMLSRAICADL